MFQKISIPSPWKVIGNFQGVWSFKTVSRKVWGCLHEKTHTGASFTPGWLLDFVSRLHDENLTSYCFYTKGHFTLIKCMPSWIVEICACATHSSPLRGLFHPEMSGCSSFTWYFCEISSQKRNSCSGTATRVNLHWYHSIQCDIFLRYRVN